MRRALLGLTVGAVVTVSVAVHAQSVPDEGNSGGAQLDIPANVTLFGNRDPNIRTATAIVNGQVITQTDVDQRLALVVVANGGRVAEEERDRLRLQVLRNIIDETLQIQEAAANDIHIAPDELQQNFARVAANFRSTPEAFTKYLRDNGSAPASIMRQIEGELAWQRLLRRKVQPFVNVSQDEVTAIMDRMKAAQGSEEFRVGEIYLSSTPDNQEQIKANADKIIEQIKAGGSFQAYARQYSEASTASVGGDLGWVRTAQLPQELAATVQQMQPGGFDILYLIDKRRVLSADPRDAVLSLKQVGINFAQGTTPVQAKAIADKFGEQVKAIQGCGNANAVAHQIGAEVVDNDGVKVRDLPPQLQQIMTQLQVGQSTPPFGAVSDGVRVLVLCGRDDPVDGQMPSADQVMAQMEEERVNKRARIYLRDLRRDAIIEYN